LKFAFTDLIQADLDTMVTTWNMHKIRHNTSNGVDGIPNELFYLPEIRGSYYLAHSSVTAILNVCVGRNDYSRECDDTDLQLCWQYACEKPSPTSTEFTNLAEIIIEEEHLQMPETPKEALELHFNLLNCITS
jgi:hypothetical protein